MFFSPILPNQNNCLTQPALHSALTLFFLTECVVCVCFKGVFKKFEHNETCKTFSFFNHSTFFFFLSCASRLLLPSFLGEGSQICLVLKVSSTHSGYLNASIWGDSSPIHSRLFSSFLFFIFLTWNFIFHVIAL